MSIKIIVNENKDIPISIQCGNQTISIKACVALESRSPHRTYPSWQNISTRTLFERGFEVVLKNFLDSSSPEDLYCSRTSYDQLFLKSKKEDHICFQIDVPDETNHSWAYEMLYKFLENNVKEELEKQLANSTNLDITPDQELFYLDCDEIISSKIDKIILEYNNPAVIVLDSGRTDFYHKNTYFKTPTDLTDYLLKQLESKKNDKR